MFAGLLCWGSVLDASNAHYIRPGSRLEEIGIGAGAWEYTCKSFAMSQVWILSFGLKFEELSFKATLVRIIVWLTC